MGKELGLEGDLLDKLKNFDPSHAGQSSRMQGLLDRGTEKAFKRRQGVRRERGARLGLEGSSFDAERDARLTSQEADAYGRNAVESAELGRRYGREDLSSLLQRLGPVRGAGRYAGQGQMRLDESAADGRDDLLGGIGGLLGKGVGDYFGDKDILGWLGRKFGDRRQTSVPLGGGRRGM